MKRYYNNSTNEWYNEGSALTRRVDNGVFSGIPSEEQLKEWGFEEYVAPELEEPTEEEIAERDTKNKIIKKVKED